MMRECQGARVTEILMWAGCECMGGTRGSGVMYRADDVLEMIVVRGVTSVCGRYEMVMCLARGGAGWEL